LGWSSDGTDLLIKRSLELEPGDPQQLIILHADGTETELVRRSWIGGASISPDGSRVAYMSYGNEGDGEPRGLYLVDADGGPSVLLAEASRAVLDGPTFWLLDEPIFSPDGIQIAYVEMVGEWPQLENRVWMVNADGSGAHVIVENEVTLEPGFIVGLEWSPTGDRIAMGLARLSNSHKKYTFAGIYTFSPDGSRFTHVIKDGVSPTWSPDGSRIAFEGALSTNGIIPSRLMIADADGSDRQDLNLRAAGAGLWHPGR
jgi:Tol biopolymer transport system component